MSTITYLPSCRSESLSEEHVYNVPHQHNVKSCRNGERANTEFTENKTTGFRQLSWWVLLVKADVHVCLVYVSNSLFSTQNMQLLQVMDTHEQRVCTATPVCQRIFGQPFCYESCYHYREICQWAAQLNKQSLHVIRPGCQSVARADIRHAHTCIHIAQE